MGGTVNHSPCSGRRILVIDDDDLVRETLRRALETAGFQVVEAADGRQGTRLYRSDPVDLVITDLLMPVKEGIETIRELRQINADAKIIAISGGGRAGAVDFLGMAKKLGADRVIAKSFRPADLIDAVRAVLDGAPWRQPRPTQVALTQT